MPSIFRCNVSICMRFYFGNIYPEIYMFVCHGQQKITVLLLLERIITIKLKSKCVYGTAPTQRFTNIKMSISTWFTEVKAQKCVHTQPVANATHTQRIKAKQHQTKWKAKDGREEVDNKMTERRKWKTHADRVFHCGKTTMCGMCSFVFRGSP